MRATYGYLLIILLSLFAQASAFAVEKLQIENSDVKVYSSASLNSPVIAVLKKGQSVSAGVNPALGFKKVLVQDASGKKVIGYISLEDLKPPIFPTEKKPGKGKKKEKNQISGQGLRGHYAAGFNLGVTYDNQSISTISDSSGNSAALSGLSGTNIQFGLGVYIPLNQKWSVEVDMNYKPTTLTGTGTATGSTQSSNIVSQQSFVAVSATGKYYGGASDWWYGGGIELDYGMSGSLQIGSRPKYTYVSTDLKQYWMIFAATGYDFISGKNFYITPSFRLGAVVNGSPIIYEFGMLFSGSYRF